MENNNVIKLIEDFLKKRKEASLEVLYKDSLNNLESSIDRSQEDKALKDKAKQIIDTNKTKEQSKLDSIIHKFNLISSLNYSNINTIYDIRSDLYQKITKIDKQFSPAQWIDDAASKASGVDLEVTHIAKLTHSSAKGSNINVKLYQSLGNKLFIITDNSSSDIPIDFCYSSAEYAPVAEFLQLDCEGLLLGKMLCENSLILKPYAESEKQLKKWQEQFSLAFNDKTKSTHNLLKQIYYPVESDYHLLTPLVSSSLAQIIHTIIRQSASKKDSKLSTVFLKTATLKVTQTNHQNVSKLNGKRNGHLILLPAAPPEWKTQLKPPLKVKSIFNRELDHQAHKLFEELRNLLVAIKMNKLSLNLQRKQHIVRLINEIAYVVFDYVALIQGLKQFVGWSQESQLLYHQQLWLDPSRSDDEFQENRTNTDWQLNIPTDFSKWVNRNLKHPKLTLGVEAENHWGKLFTPLLREFNAIVVTTLDDSAIIEGKHHE